jgi:hypothetical protein
MQNDERKLEYELGENVIAILRLNQRMESIDAEVGAKTYPLYSGTRVSVECGAAFGDCLVYLEGLN